MDLANVVPVSEESRCKKARDKMVELQLEGTAIDRKIAEQSVSSPGTQTLDAQARAYMETGKLSLEPRPADLEGLYARRRVNTRAVKMARDDFESACEAYSREACAQLERPYRQHAQRIADALAILMDSACAERDFRGALEAKGIRVSFAPAAFPYLGFSLDDPDKGFAARWVKDARQAGLIR